MIPAAISAKARKAARYHARVRVVAVEVPAHYSGGPCTVKAEVDRIFRGDDDQLRAGQVVELELFCFVPPDESPTGPTWLDYSELRAGSALEGFFNRTSAGRFEVATFQIAFTAESGAEPDGSLWPAVAADTALPARLLRWVKSTLGT